MPVLMDPNCLDGNHRSCAGGGWCEETDQLAPCPCECHGGPVGGEHFPGCPCGTCQSLRAARPAASAIQAKHLSGASIGKLVEYSTSRSITTNEHLWSPAATLINVWHAEDSTEIAIDYDHVQDHADTYDQIGLKPTDWVRVTRVAA